MLLRSLGLLSVGGGPSLHQVSKSVLRLSVTSVTNRHDLSHTQSHPSFHRGHKTIPDSYKSNPKLLNVTQIHPVSTVGVRRRSTLPARLVNSSPSGMQPFMKLARLDKPVGKLMFLDVNSLNA